MECPANFYCVQGTTRPTPCPPGTVSGPKASQCTPGIQRVALFDWIITLAWIVLFSCGVVGLGLFKRKAVAAKEEKDSSLPGVIQIQIVR